LILAGVTAEVRKEGGRDKWYIEATTDRLAAGREELRKAIAEIVKKARDDRLIDASKAKRWLKKLEDGLTLMEGWPKYYVGLKDGALEVIYKTTNSGNIEQVAQRLRDMGLVEDVHFVVKMPGDGRYGYVSILKEGLAYAAWLSVHGSGDQQRLAARLVEYILDRAEKAGKDVYRKAEEIVEEGKARDSQTLENFEKKVEVNGKTYVVKVLGGGAEFDEGRSGKKLLRIKIRAEVGRVEGGHIVDRVVREYEITFGRYGSNNAVRGFANVSKETDAERLAAVIEALTGVKPKIHRRSDGIIEIVCTRAHLEGFKRFAKLAKAIIEWLKETGR
jgi:nucleotide-binding universal stress UspA family protein